jgi:hypothetical protein
VDHGVDKKQRRIDGIKVTGLASWRPYEEYGLIVDREQDILVDFEPDLLRQ